ncbi:unnamed protein product [Lota lota]
MNGSRVSDFSIDHILSWDFPHSAGSSPQKTHRNSPPPGEAYLHRVEGGLCYADPCRTAPGAPVVLCVPGRLCCYWPGPAASSLFSYGGFRQDLFPPDLTFYPRHKGREPGPAAGHARRPVQRSRTVFTASQTQQLECLFHKTDYPAADARAELAVNSGLMEETVRVWFKNRRARRKRQKSRPEAKTTSRRALAALEPRDTLLSAAL